MMFIILTGVYIFNGSLADSVLVGKPRIEKYSDIVIKCSSIIKIEEFEFNRKYTLLDVDNQRGYYFKKTPKEVMDMINEKCKE